MTLKCNEMKRKRIYVKANIEYVCPYTIILPASHPHAHPRTHQPSLQN